MLRRTGQWQGNRTPDNQAANKLVDAGGIWFEDVGSTPTASIFCFKIESGTMGLFEEKQKKHLKTDEKLRAGPSRLGSCRGWRA